MSSDFNGALLVLVVGMLTVFVILSLVIVSGQLLIKLLNKSGFVLNKVAEKSPLKRGAVGTAAIGTVSTALAPNNQEHPEKETVKAIELAIQKWSSSTAQVIGLTNLQTGEKLIGNKEKSVESKAIEAAIQKWSQGKASVQAIQKIS